MIFVFGGAYQGKRDFVKENFSVQDGDESILDNINEWIRNLVEDNRDSDAGLDALLLDISEREKELPQGREVIIIMNDVSQGLVPMDPVERAYREANGRAMIKLAKEASAVYRVFCGIGTKIK